MDDVRFYQRTGEGSGAVIPKEKVSSMIPTCFEERYVRVYTRDVALGDLVRFGFEQWYARTDYRLYLSYHIGCVPM